MGALYTGAFELRRMVVRYTRAPAGGTTEDAEAFTIHFAKIVAGAPDPGWLTADYNAVEVAMSTWWAAVKANFLPHQTLADVRWYKDGDAFSPIDRGDGPPNPSVRTTAFGNVATGSSANAPPPQVACSVTKVCDVRKRWGRMYLPAPAAAVLTTEGRFTNAFTDLLVSAMVTMMNSCRAGGRQPVVWSRARSAYVTPRGAAIPAHPASAYEITSVQADNLADIIRSRRYGAPTRRTVTALT